MATSPIDDGGGGPYRHAAERGASWSRSPFVPWPQSWPGVRSVIASARSSELNRAEREAHAAGYYEGLIGGGDGPEGARGELALRLMGRPNGWVRFNDADVSRMLPGRLPPVRARAGHPEGPSSAGRS